MNCFVFLVGIFLLSLLGNKFISWVAPKMDNDENVVLSPLVGLGLVT
jgi:hypothetical protein